MTHFDKLSRSGLPQESKKNTKNPSKPYTWETFYVSKKSSSTSMKILYVLLLEGYWIHRNEGSSCRKISGDQIEEKHILPLIARSEAIWPSYAALRLASWLSRK